MLSGSLFLGGYILFQKRDICVGIEGVSGFEVGLGVGWVSGGC